MLVGYRRGGSLASLLVPALVGFVAAAAVLFAIHPFIVAAGAPWEHRLLLHWHTLFGTPGWQRVAGDITFLGEEIPVIAIALIAIIWWAVRGFWWKVTLLIVDGILLDALRVLGKEFFHRLRPELFPHIAESGFSYPSGHALFAVGFFGLLFYLGLVHGSSAARWIGWIVWVLFAAGIGWSRLVLGVHWPTDVLAGFAAGTIMLIALTTAARRWHPQSGNTRLERM